MSTNQFTTLLYPMPIPGTANAPRFNGRFTKDYLGLIVQHGTSAGITDKDDLVDYIYRYSSDEVKEVIRYVPELDIDEKSKTWAAAETKLLQLYRVGDEPPEISLDALKDFCKRQSAKSSFTTTLEVETYQREFTKIAAPLRKKKIITKEDHDFYFVNGIPTSMKEWFYSQVPVANRKRSAPPPMTDSIEILSRRFDTDSLIYEDWRHAKERESKTVKFDANGDRLDSDSKPLPPSRAQTPPASKQAKSSVPDIDALAKQLQDLSLNQAQLMAMMTASMNSAPSEQRPPMQQNSGRCFICGKWNAHPLHPRHCHETLKLIEERRIKYDANRDRYVQMDGSDLPQTPRGFYGGVADWLRQQNPAPTDSAPAQATARTSSLGLSYGHSDVLQGDVFAVSSLSFDERFSNPSLRSGKDTSSRYDPMRRPEDKGKGKEEGAPAPASVPRPQSSQPTPGPSFTRPSAFTPPAPATTVPVTPAPARTNIPPPSNPINTQEGWKNSRPSNNKPRNDVEMKDGTRKPADKSSTGAQFHFTSDIQEMSDPKAVMNTLMNLDVTIPLFQLVGNSTVLQKMMAEATRTKREYTTKQAEYLTSEDELYAVEDIDQFERMAASAGCSRDGTRHFHCEDSYHMHEFLRRYGNAIAQVPSTRYFAMATGSFHLTINGTDFTAMIDTGSELNLATVSLPGRCGLAVDFEGMKWSLKGIHGDPERLSGCATDVPLHIGSHDFVHHLFISHQELGKHDIILGQPFLQWFAARLDYERTGQVKLILWKDGDRRQRPTLSVTITDPQDTRNATKISHSARVRTTQIEEVTDEEDFPSGGGTN
ncbi:uncharacterized protein ARMOST_13410 [Armillaria ostoyae]|uniref:DUF4100 domain-containing protein n=1 Tax=Armillaria ostoyae TaxID=47428 RepID=A0A284RMQ8_ARMOS|nr:uncharacterized protein ARMOST_13410 [Armillaria ostoyae]